MKDLYVIDLETYARYFLYMGLNIRTGEWKQFEISKSYSDLFRLRTHLVNDVSGMITFNGLAFDYPIIHQIGKGKVTTAEQIYTLAQNIINSQNSDNNFEKYKYSIKDADIVIPQLDLFKMLHLDNPAKRASLKDLEIFLRMDRVEDLPVHHSENINYEQSLLVVDYCKNDVIATKKLYEFCKDRIALRKVLSKKYGSNLMSKADASIGSTILEKEYIKKTGVTKQYLKELKGSEESNFKIKEIISPKVKFTSPTLMKFFTQLGETNIDVFKEKSVIYKGVKSVVAKGGLHSDMPPLIKESSLTHSIIDLDFGSYYPGLMLSLNVYPKHLGVEFLEVLKDLTDQRLLAKKNKDVATDAALKITINSIYGKLGNDHSFTKDFHAMYSVTLNGQLFLLMLCEQLTNLKGVECFYQNTDGATFMVENSQIKNFHKIADAFAQYVTIPVELTNYKKCILRDVNNYIIETELGKIKAKGCFVTDKEYYQDTSFKIVPIALKEYFTKGIPLKTTIETHKDILDFCGRFKCNKGWRAELRSIGTDFSGSPYLKKDKLQKTNRYFISTNGGSFLKIHEDGREQFIERDRIVTIFNNAIYKDMKEYSLDYNYYLIECEKIRRQVETEQLQLF